MNISATLKTKIINLYIQINGDGPIPHVSWASNTNAPSKLGCVFGLHEQQKTIKHSLV